MRATVRNDFDVPSKEARTALSHRIWTLVTPYWTGIRRRRLSTLAAELAGPRQAAGKAGRVPWPASWPMPLPGRRAADRRHGSAGRAAPGREARPSRLRPGEEEAEHREGHR